MEEREGLNRRVFVAGGLLVAAAETFRGILKPAGDRFEENTMHGLAPCGVEP